MVIFVAALVISGIIQTVAICRLFALRRTPDATTHPAKQSEIRKWMRWCRAAWLAGAFTALIAPIVLRAEGLILMPVGLGSTTLLMIVAGTISDRSTGHGDGDSGG